MIEATPQPESLCNSEPPSPSRHLHAHDQPLHFLVLCCFRLVKAFLTELSVVLTFKVTASRE
jgi:hypothetical protein